jgi:hypothetical protein
MGVDEITRTLFLQNTVTQVKPYPKPAINIGTKFAPLIYGSEVWPRST